MFLAPGSLTSGDIEAVLGVGPIAPATNFLLEVVEYLLRASQANLAEFKFMS